MPYARNSELPKGLRGALPSAAQTVWRNVFNSQSERGLSDSRAAASAWGALENQGWKKGDDGKWRKVEKADFRVAGEVSKLDEDQRIAFGWANVVEKDGQPITDSQEDVIDISDLEKAAYDYVLLYRDAGEMHESLVGKMIESMVVTGEKLAAWGLEPDSVDPGWWVGFKLEQEAFDKVKSGEYKMFSIGGTATRTPEE